MQLDLVVRDIVIDGLRVAVRLLSVFEGMVEFGRSAPAVIESMRWLANSTVALSADRCPSGMNSCTCPVSTQRLLAKSRPSPRRDRP